MKLWGIVSCMWVVDIYLLHLRFITFKEKSIETLIFFFNVTAGKGRDVEKRILKNIVQNNILNERNSDLQISYKKIALSL